MKKRELQAELTLSYRSYLKRRMSMEDFKEKKREILAKIKAINEELRTGKKQEANPFDKLSHLEIDKIMQILRNKEKLKKGETEYSLREKLVALGHDKKIAEKAAEIIFEKDKE